MKKSLRFFHLAVLFGSSVIHANAASGTWTNTATGGLWSTTGNWTSGTVADGSGFTANFSTLDLPADNTVQLDSPRTLTSLTFGDTEIVTTPANWVLANNATPANVLTLAGTTPTITVSALGTGKTATISAILGGTGNLTKAGAGTLVLSGVNTYSGATIVSAGKLAIASGGSVSSTAGGSAVNSGGILEISGLFAMSGTAGLTTNGASSTNTIDIKTGGSFTNSGTGGVIIGQNVATHEGILNVSGTYNQSAGSIFFGNNVATVKGTLNVNSGGLVTFAAGMANSDTSGTTNAAGVVLGRGVAGATGTINLETGGTLETAKNIVRGAGVGNFNFNGGTLKALADSTNTGLDVTTTTVNSGGANVNTNGFNFLITDGLVAGSGSGGITKTGAGALTLAGANTISGAYTVSAGGLVLAGTNVNIPGVTLGANAFGLKVPNAVPSGTAITATTGTVYLADGVTTNANATFSNGGSRNGFFLGNAANWGGSMTFSGTGGTNFATSTGATISGNVSTAGTIIFRTDSGGATSNPIYGYTAPSGTASVTISGITSGTGGIQAGVGTAAFNVTLTGVNTYTGTTGIQNGGSTLTIGGAGSLGSGSYAGAISFLTSGATLRYNSTAAQTFSGLMSGAGGNLTKDNTGTLTLSGTNTYTGATSINAGQLVLDYNVTASSVLASTSALQTRGGEMVFTNLGTKNQTFASTAIVSGTTSKLTLGSGYTSGVVNLGTMSRTLGTLDVSSLTGAPGWIKATGNLSAPILFHGAVTTNNRTSLVATDASGFLITAAVTDHSRGGAVTTGDGVVRVIETGAGPNTAATPVSLTGLPGSTTDITSLINSYSPATASPDTGLIVDIGATKTLRLSATGFVSSVAGTSLTLTNGTLTSGGATDTAGVLTFVSASPIIVDSVIADNGAGIVDVVKLGADTLTFSGSASNTYTGTTTISAGPLTLSKTGGAIAVPGNLVLPNLNDVYVTPTADNQFGSTTVLSFSGTTANGRLNLMGTSQALAGISETNGRGVVQNSESPYGPTNAGTGTLTLNVTGTPSFNGYLRNQTGTLALIKTGSGTQTLIGNNITHTGNTTVSAGTLKYTSTGALNSNITNNATVEINAVANDWSMGAKTLSGPGIWNKTGVGTATFSNSIVTASGQINVTTGTLRNNNNASNWSGSTADIDISSGAILDLFADAIYVDQLTGTGFVQNGYGNTSGQSGASAFTEKLVVGVANGSSTFSGVIRNNTTNSVPASALGGAVQVEKVGTGSLTLTGANSYTGLTSIGGGQLILDYTTPASVLGATPLQANGGELVFTSLGSKTQTLPSTTVVSGVSKITLGSGYAGGVVDLGTLARSGGALEISSIAANPGWIKATGSPSVPYLFGGAITTDGGITPLATDAGGVLMAATTSDWSRGGTATVTGILRLIGSGSGPNTAGLPVSLAGLPGSVLDIPSIFNGYTLAAAAPDTSITLDIGTGKTLRLAAAGHVTSSAGTNLVLTNGTLTAGGADNTTGTITFNAVNNITVGSTITDNGSGVVGIVKNGVGTLTLNGSNTYTGTIALNGGTLELGGSNTPAGPVSVGGGTLHLAVSNALPSGTPVTLNNTGILQVSGNSTLGLVMGDGVTGVVTGSGTLTLTAANFQLGTATVGSTQTLNLSGLGGFAFNAPSNSFNVGGTGSGVGGTKAAVLTLGTNSSITAASIGIANLTAGFSGTATNNGTVNLGQATTFNADTIKVGAYEANGVVQFRGGLTNPSLTIRGTAGDTTRANLNFGVLDGSGANFGPGVSTWNTGAGSIDARFGTLMIGRNDAQNANIPNQQFTMGTGTLDATTIIIGQHGGGNGGVTGTFTQGGGTVIADTLTLGVQTGGGGATNATYNLNGGGTLQARAIGSGAGAFTSRVLNWNDGTITNYDSSTLLNVGSGVTFQLAGSGTHAFDIQPGLLGSVASVIANAPSATGALDKNGEGTLALIAASTYSGGTTVNEGVLLANNPSGSAAGTGAVTVKSGATFGGTGSVTGAVTLESGAILSPGVSIDSLASGSPIESLATGSLTLPAGTSYLADVDSGNPGADVVNVSGDVSLGGTLTVTDMALPSVALASGSKFILMSYTGTLTGTFAGLAENATVTVGANQFKIHYNDSKKVTLELLAGPYDSWATSKGLTSGNNGADQDADNDGLKNLIEFYLNGNPLDGKPVVAPVATVDEDYLILTFERATAALSQSGLTAAVQYGSDLNGWEEMAIAAASSGPDANGVIVTVVDHPSAPSTITVKIPKDYATDGKLFGRLKVQR